MQVKHMTHTEKDGWFDVIDSDPDVDFETGRYLGIRDMIKLSDGQWYPQNECVYLNAKNEEKPCV